MINILYFIYILVFNFCLAFYLISALQWYSYRLKRVAFHYHNYLWHFYFLFVPYLIYILSFGFSYIGLIYFCFIHATILYFWNKKIDKKLVLTSKVKWFFVFVFILNFLFCILSYKFSFLLNLLTLPSALFCLKIYDFFSNFYFKQKAKNKISKIKNLKIILITASFGKTSIKNFLYELLKDDFSVHKTPRSVNTFLGIVKDINENLSLDTQIYIVEAGARLKGDILQITSFLNPEICIVGEIGKAHLEYFKSEENIRQTKLEALQSLNLKKAFLHSSTKESENDTKIIYDKALKQSISSLEGLKFQVKINDELVDFKANLLGEFNAENLCVCLLVASYLGLKNEKLQRICEKIPSVEHRLQILQKKPKFIIDDGFNGNFKGMSQSYELCKSYKGRKILVSPGIVEVNKEENIRLCTLINECFDLAIITAKSNAEIFKKELKIENIILKEKSELVEILAKHTKDGDLILFSNDAPSYL